MNKQSILRNGTFTNLHGTWQFTIEYPHSKVMGYDNLGRAVNEVQFRNQVFYGVTKREAKLKAEQCLAVECWESERMIRTVYCTLGMVRR